jgi:3',5'-nucleoside bisphosphate phosphatase
LSPEELVQVCTRFGITTIAITDHDNANGSREAEIYAKSAGIALIPAIEFTSSWPSGESLPDECDIDVLGYFVNLADSGFQAFERAAMSDLEERIDYCCRTLTSQGYPVKLEEMVENNPNYIGMLSLIHQLMKKGYASSWDQAASLGYNPWRKFRSSKFEIGFVIDQIHQAGGAAVLAHPSQLTFKGQLLTSKQLQWLIGQGLDGLEVYHPRVNLLEREYFLALATQFSLLITGGSDEHGWHPEKYRYGSQPVTMDSVNVLKKCVMTRAKLPGNCRCP